MTEASALEMLRSPSAPSPHGEEEEGLGVAEEEDLLGRASPRGGLCGLLRACVPGGCFLLSLACCRSSSWMRLKQGDDGSEAPARKKKRSSRWKDGSSQFEEYARRAPRRYEHDLMTDDGVDGSGVENPLVSRAAAAAAAAPASPPKAGGRAIGRALDDGTRRLTSGQEKGDSTSLQRGCFRRNARVQSIHASSSPREMIARPKISQNAWETTEIRASKVWNCSPFSCPGSR